MPSSSFTAYSPNWPSNRRFDLWDIIPTINKAEDTTEHLERFILCIQDQLDTTLAWIDNWSEILDADRAPDQYLDLMLKDLGNPFVFEDLTENDKRLLLRVLVRVYQLKGTIPGIQAAIRFFMGFESQIHLYRHSGSLLGSVTPPVIISRLSDSFVLGGGGPFDFAIVVATTEAAGRPLTQTEITRIKRIVSVVKAAPDRLLEPIFYGLPAPTRVGISGDASSVTVTWKQTAVVPTFWRVYYRRTEPGVTPFNSAAYIEVAGALTTATMTTPVVGDDPGSLYHFVVVPYFGREGFTSETEVRNNLPAPASVLATGGPLSVTVSWSAVPGATSYRVYKGVVSAGNPTGASDPVGADFVYDVLGGATEFKDAGMLPGQAANYRVTALVGNAEGFYSANVSGAAT